MQVLSQIECVFPKYLEPFYWEGELQDVFREREFSFHLTRAYVYHEKNLDLTQINYAVLTNFNIGAGKYPKYAYADFKQLHLIGQVRYHETIVKNNRRLHFKMADQKRSDFYVVFTMSLCALELK